jgi:hypothetical protein
MKERRSHPRVKASRSVLYFTDIYPRPKVAATVDLSLGGTRVKTLDRLNPGEGIEIVIALDPKAIKCRGQVIHVHRPEGEGLEAGVRFEDLSEEDKLCLRQSLLPFMDEQGSSPPPEKTPL